MKIVTSKSLLYVFLIAFLMNEQIFCNKNDFDSIYDLQRIFDQSSQELNDYTFIENASKNLMKKIRFNNNLKFTNITNSNNKTTNSNSTNSNNTNSNSTKISTIISKAPFKASQCDQILMFPGKRIQPENDYGKKSEAFFTMSALLLNTFEKQDSSKLVKSIKLINVKKSPSIIQGSINCLLFLDSIANTNSTVCIEDEKERKNILDSFTFLKRCIRARPKGYNKKQAKSQLEQITEILKIIDNPEQKSIDIRNFRKDMIMELNKKGINATVNEKGKECDDKYRNKRNVNNHKRGRSLKVPGSI